MCPILKSPHDVALIQLHTAWELLHGIGGSEHLAAWHGQLHWQGRQHPGKYQTRGFIDTGIVYTRQDVQGLPSKLLNVAKSLPMQVSKSTVKPPQGLLFHCVLGAASHHQESFLSRSCLSDCFIPSSLPGCPSAAARPSLLPAAGRPLVGLLGARCNPLGAGYLQEPVPGTSPGVQGCTIQPPSSWQPCRPLRSSQMAGKKGNILKWFNSFTYKL